MNKYAFFDGDNIGDTIQRFLHDEELDAAMKFSKNVKEYFLQIQEKIEKMEGVRVLIAGGDDLLIEYNPDKVSLAYFEEIRRNFYEKTQTTLSCGIGSTVKEASFNLYIAKLYGRNRIATD